MNAILPNFDFNNNKLKPVFNISDYTDVTTRSVTVADLLNYASLTGYNSFTSLNTFTVISFTNSLNGVDPETFSYISTLSGNVEDQLITLKNKTQAMEYNLGGTLFNSNVAIPVITLNGKNLESRLIVSENDISNIKTKTTAQEFKNNRTQFATTIEAPSISLNGTDLNDRLIFIENDVDISKLDINSLKVDVSSNKININTNTLDITNLKIKDDALLLDIQTLESDLLSLDSSVLKINGDQIINDVKTFTTAPKINNDSIATVQNINQAIGNLINSAPSTYDTLGEIAIQLQADTNSINTILSTMVTLSGNQSVTGVKTFTKGIIAQSTSAFTNLTASTVTFNNTINNIGKTTFSYLANVTSDIQTQFNNISNRFVNYVYDPTSNTQRFNTSTAFNDIGAQNIMNTNLIASNINALNISANSLQVNRVESFIPFPFPYGYFYSDSGFQFPVLVTNQPKEFSDLGITNVKMLTFTLMPYTRLNILDENQSSLLFIYNEADEILYNKTFQFKFVAKFFTLERIKM